MKRNFWFFIWLISFLGLFLFFSKETPEDLDVVLSETKIQPASTEVSIKVEASEKMDEVLIQSEDSNLNEIEEPISLVFPLPGDAPVSLWRPPLYSTPWALTPNDHFFFKRPIAADEINWPLANYRFGYFFPDTDIIHTGIDITAKRGTPVIAAAAGKVIWVGYGLYYGRYDEEDPYGLAVTIEHDFGYGDKKLMTVYGHMDRIDVEKDQRVEAGTQLGIVGNTGKTTGPHLHFEVRVETNSYFRTRNPELWLAPPQGWGVLVGQIKDSTHQYVNLKEVYVRNLDTNQTWMVLTYATNNINRDEYYKENFVLSDLPAGNYLVSFTYDGTLYKNEITIYPGAISYFTFIENFGFSHKVPNHQTPEEWDDIVFPEVFVP
jgi:murein DD-endopeptidase MepM/ murein hydrolase activator NlpD